MEKFELLFKHLEEIYPSRENLVTLLKESKKLKIYLGIDPTSPEIHLGHAIALWKLKEFQEAGHQVILLVGDFTAMIGDPSDKEATRKSLSREEVLANTANFKKQASKILNFSGENAAKLEFNSHWLAKLTLSDLLDLAAKVTVQQLYERDMFQKRLKGGKPIGLHEFLYPLLQGYDSVAMAVDAELGGSDQTFNMLFGRTLLKSLKHKEKFVLTLPLLEGTDGQKMSKSYGNTINISNSSTDMFGKVMSLKDELIIKYFDLCTKVGSAEIKKMSDQIKSINPMELKKKLAFEIVAIYHGKKAAQDSQKEFSRVFQEGKAPKGKRMFLPNKINADATTILEKLSMVKSKSEARRLIEQGGVYINGRKVDSLSDTFSLETGTLVQIGKLRSVSVEIRKDT
ncbi:MAG: tyrosine--tRNA ligase [Candidatus Woykebacteria bacterium]